jgi:hypothetical protein
VPRIGQLYVPRNRCFPARDWHIMTTLSRNPGLRSACPSCRVTTRWCCCWADLADLFSRIKPNFDPTTPQARQAWQAMAR